MLLQLSVRNIVLIDRLALEFAPGFNVITGETGAGKSMLVDALNLVLGGRARPELLRSGTDEAEVEALFEIAAGSRAAAKLEASGIPGDRELVVRRVLQAAGGGTAPRTPGPSSGAGAGRVEIRTRAYINGRLCTAAQLAEIASELCDIASQHESVSLTDPATHVDYLDAFGRLEGQREAVAAEVAALGEVSREFEALTAKERGRAEREDFLRWQIREIDEIDPREGEETEIEQERARLRHAERLQTTTKGAADRLYDGEGAICDALARLAAELEQVAAIDGSLSGHARVVDAARAELADAARALGRYAEAVEASPERLAEVEERAFRLQKLLRKHGPTTVDVRAHRAALDAELAAMEGATQRLAELAAKRAELVARVGVIARALSRKRREAADRLADAIGAELAQLGMGRARVIVEVTPATALGGAELVDGARLTRTGIDRVEFLIAPNRGEEPRPLRKIASGGELSRALLALKRVLADQGPAGTYVFDEVDAGVGGAIAEVIGRAIDDIARHRQVCCITHLPQIAALADAHFVVEKVESRGRTHASVRRLSPAERVDEIARMIGGIKVGDAAKRAAAEMLASKSG
ncbi:MAG TPA: DNA repair protein RecN [Polyangiaceae bacterium]|nr:DNA repair protein RecN [Polyangiaceae bacterium]